MKSSSSIRFLRVQIDIQEGNIQDGDQCQKACHMTYMQYKDNICSGGFDPFLNKCSDKNM